MSGPFHAWMPQQVSRQGYANACITELLETPGIKKFAQLLEAFREAGREWDREESFRRRQA